MLKGVLGRPSSLTMRRLSRRYRELSDADRAELCRVGRAKTELYRLTTGSVFPTVARLESLELPEGAPAARGTIVPAFRGSLAAQVSAAKASHAKKTAELTLQVVQQEAALAVWSQGQQHSIAGHAEALGLKEAQQPQGLFYMFSDGSLLEGHVQFPATELLLKALGGASGDLAAALRSRWMRRQMVHRHSLAPPIGAVPRRFLQPSICSLAGICLHTLPDVAAFEVAFIEHVASFSERRHSSASC